VIPVKPIIQLDKPLINKIAAGEVVERPLSVVKELLENAIDAGASIITVEIAEGGLSSIRVTDNGVGIPADQILLAFARHATSKISSFDDLFEVGTLGFRGEALSSIAAVAQVEMLTKTAGAITGVRVEIHGGQMLSRQDIGSADGTTVIVSNLFYNTPARRKFLKKPAIEAGYIADCLQKLALGNPRLTIRYISNGQIAFQTNGRGELKTTMLSIYGHEAASKLINVSAKQDEMAITGLIGKPEIARGNRQRQSFFINGRLISSRLLTQAVEEATKTMLPGGKFPVYVLNLTVPHDGVDVNVHPTKMDVRFADESQVFRFIQGAVREALTESNLIPEVRFGGRKEREGENMLPQMRLNGEGRQSHAYDRDTKGQPPSRPEPSAFLREDKIPPMPERPVSMGGEKPYTFAPSAYTSKTTTNQPSQEECPQPYDTAQPSKLEHPTSQQEASPTTPAPPFFTNYRIIALIFETYWLITQDQSLYLVDQHAAHERVLYEEIIEQTATGPILSQPLLTPIPLRLTMMEESLLKDNLPLFTRFGFEITGLEERDTQNPPLLVSVPYLLKGPTRASFFTDILDKIGESGFSQGGIYAHKTEAIAMAACKAAVKAGDHLAEPEARALIKKMLSLENPFTCPHGRPTIIEITQRELERRFKRS